MGEFNDTNWLQAITPDRFNPMGSMAQQFGNNGQAAAPAPQESAPAPPPQAASPAAPTIVINTGGAAPAAPAPPVNPFSVSGPIPANVRLPAGPVPFDSQVARDYVRLNPAIPEAAPAAPAKRNKLQMLGEILRAVGEIGTGISMGAPQYAEFANRRQIAKTAQEQQQQQYERMSEQQAWERKKWEMMNDPAYQAAQRAQLRQEGMTQLEQQERLRRQIADEELDRRLEALRGTPYESLIPQLRAGIPVKTDTSQTEPELFYRSWKADPQNQRRPESEWYADYNKAKSLGRATPSPTIHFTQDAKGNQFYVVPDKADPTKFVKVPVGIVGHVPNDTGETAGTIVTNQNDGNQYWVPKGSTVGRLLTTEEKEPMGGRVPMTYADYTKPQLDAINAALTNEAIVEWNKKPENKDNPVTGSDPMSLMMNPKAAIFVQERLADVEAQKRKGEQLFPQKTSRQQTPTQGATPFSSAIDKHLSQFLGGSNTEPKPKGK